MTVSLLEKLRRFSGQIPKMDARLAVGVSQLLQEKAAREEPTGSVSDNAGVSREIPNGDIQELILKLRGSGPAGTPGQRLRATEHATTPPK